MGAMFETWGRATGNKAAYVQVDNVKEYDAIWPSWGMEMGSMMAFWGEMGDKSWTMKGEKILTRDDLGLKAEWVGIEEAFKGMDWKAIL